MTSHWKATRPRTTHWREASCKDANCLMYINGWETILSVTDIANINLIRRSGMSYREEQDQQLIRFQFSPGQECFTGQANGHRIAIERDPIFRRNDQIMEPFEWMDKMNDTFYRIQEV